MKILLAEDDPRLGKLISQMLKKKEGYLTDWVTTGEDVYEYAISSTYDVIILDWMMPGGDGIQTCKKLRNKGYEGAILMLTAKDTLENKVEGLESGADDYLIKPFEFEELIARLRTLQRRNFAPLQDEVITVQGMSLNRSNQTVCCNEKDAIQLSPREFQLMDFLLQNPGRVLTRDLLLDRIWGLSADVNEKIVDATVKHIRKKLGKEFIQSVRGVGYKIDG
ncbi:response regulator transcription factor [Paenibacillus agricola]|uniref:Response regulator transcription factor n=1 Tax=Paenibacillus agricola TaxID=2716264 RepID=A0ABX0JD87_9BACL|nr:response regulator transcription factor [Paenibacillus agricola]NHN32817.1 response regulator transcription factor [Paenibacillus agricola]